MAQKIEPLKRWVFILCGLLIIAYMAHCWVNELEYDMVKVSGRESLEAAFTLQNINETIEYLVTHPEYIQSDQGYQSIQINLRRISDIYKSYPIVTKQVTYDEISDLFKAYETLFQKKLSQRELETIEEDFEMILEDFFQDGFTIKELSNERTITNRFNAMTPKLHYYE